jgi:hypothetical protein
MKDIYILYTELKEIEVNLSEPEIYERAFSDLMMR